MYASEMQNAANEVLLFILERQSVFIRPSGESGVKAKRLLP